MQTYEKKIKGKSEIVIPITTAFFYALQREIETILGHSIRDDEFQVFIDDKLSEVDDALVSAWNDWKEEQREIELERAEQESNYRSDVFKIK